MTSVLSVTDTRFNSFGKHLWWGETFLEGFFHGSHILTAVRNGDLCGIGSVMTPNQKIWFQISVKGWYNYHKPLFEVLTHLGSIYGGVTRNFDHSVLTVSHKAPFKLRSDPLTRRKRLFVVWGKCMSDFMSDGRSFCDFRENTFFNLSKLFHVWIERRGKDRGGEGNKRFRAEYNRVKQSPYQVFINDANFFSKIFVKHFETFFEIWLPDILKCITDIVTIFSRPYILKASYSSLTWAFHMSVWMCFTCVCPSISNVGLFIAYVFSSMNAC